MTRPAAGPMRPTGLPCVLLAVCLVLSVISPAAVPPPPRDLEEVRAALAKAPAPPTGGLRPLSIVLVANRKDHGPHEHDYPRWMDRWGVLLGGGNAGLETTRALAVNLYGRPADLSQGPPPGAANVKVQTARDWPTTAQLERADLVVAFMGTGGIWNEARVSDVKTLLNRGGGFVALHSAVIAEKPNARPLADLIGLAWEGGYTLFRHGAIELKITDPDHPICRGLPRSMHFEDETYWPLVGNASRIDLLATGDEMGKDGRLGPEPMFWTCTVGKGRAFGCILGHYNWTFDDPYFRALVLRGMAWAAGESPYRFDPLILCGARTTDRKRMTSETPVGPTTLEDSTPVAPDAADPNLLLWLDASTSSTLKVDADGRVSAWSNKAGRVGHTLTSPAAQQPLHVGKALGGKPALRFDGVDDVLRDTAFGQSLRDWTLVFVVTPHSNRGDFRALIGAGRPALNDYETGLNIDFGPNATPQFSMLNLEGITYSGQMNLRAETAPFGQGQIIMLCTGDGQSRLWINGVEEEGRAAKVAVVAMDELRIGARFHHDREQGYFHGDFSEVLVYRTPLAEQQRAGLYAHLLRKYSPDIRPPVAHSLDAWDYLPAYDWGSTRRPLASIDAEINDARGDVAILRTLEARLLEVLADPSTTPAAKDFVCRRLAIVGTEASVPVLAALLTNDQLSHMACLALEHIPGASADAALAEALDHGGGRLRLGAIHALGNRRSHSAVGVLARLTNDGDAEVSLAAIAALGKIGGPKVVETLTGVFDNATTSSLAAAAASLLKCAGHLQAAGKSTQALAICESLGRRNLPEGAHVAAVRGMIVSRGADGVPLLVQQLGSGSDRLATMALLLARELPGSDVTHALVAQLDQLDADWQERLILALGDRKDAEAKPAVIERLRNAKPGIRVAAIDALGSLGDESDVWTLLDAAGSKNADVAEAAKVSLSRLSGKNVEARLLEHLDQANVGSRRVLIDVLGRRAYAPAKSALIRSVRDPDRGIRLAAVKALGETLAPEDVPTLIDILVQSSDSADTAAAGKALLQLGVRTDHKDAWCDALLAGLPRAAPPAKAALLRALSHRGGPKALQAVKNAAQTTDTEFRDVVIRILCDWPTAEADDDLLAIIRDSSDEEHRVLALRGYFRIAGLWHVPVPQRLSMCREGLRHVRNDDERRLAIGTLAEIPNVEALKAVLPFLDVESVREEACLAALSIGDKLLPDQKAAVHEAAEKILRATRDPQLRGRAEELRSDAKESGS